MISARTPPPMYTAPSFPRSNRVTAIPAGAQGRNLSVFRERRRAGTHRSYPTQEEPDMPPRGTKKGTKRARQYEHIKDSVLDRGGSEDEAEEIAARTVNKERARSGEAREPSKLSRTDISSSRRGGLRSHRKGPRGRTRDQLYEEAKERNIRGRSRMTKAELQHALGGRR
jgi:hypothetical protein